MLHIRNLAESTLLATIRYSRVVKREPPAFVTADPMTFGRDVYIATPEVPINIWLVLKYYIICKLNIRTEKKKVNPC